MKVISKQNILEALKAGGYIIEDTVYREIRLHDCSGEIIGAVRWDTLWKLRKELPELHRECGGWSYRDRYTLPQPEPVKAPAEAPETAAAEPVRMYSTIPQALAIAEQAAAAGVVVAVQDTTTGKVIAGPAGDVVQLIQQHDAAHPDAEFIPAPVEPGPVTAWAVIESAYNAELKTEV